MTRGAEAQPGYHGGGSKLIRVTDFRKNKAFGIQGTVLAEKAVRLKTEDNNM